MDIRINCIQYAVFNADYAALINKPKPICAYEKNPHGQHSSSDSEKTDPTHPTKTMIPKPPESKHLQMRIFKDKISFQIH